MPTEFTLPELGENVQKSDVVAVLVKEGDTVQPDQPVLELETDKATIEVPSTVGGVVGQILVKPGDQVKPGQVIFTLAEVGTLPSPTGRGAGGEGESPTVSTPPPAPVAKAEEMKPVPVAAPPQPPSPLALPSVVLSGEVKKGLPAAPAAPSVRYLARELGVDINAVPGSGPSGRISQDDVKAYVRQLNTARPTASVAVETISLPDFSKWGQVEREAFSNVRRVTAQRMALAWTTIPHVTNFDQADITDLEELRKRFAKRVEAAGGKLTPTAIILKVVAAALKQFPKFNASLDVTRQEIVYKKYYNIGVAVDTERGLLVPVIRDVDRKSITQLAVELSQIAEKARARKIGLDDLEGGAFTITNLGGIGGTNFTPIINAPDVAILGIARSNIQAVYRNGQFEPRMMLPLALSYDHRLIDGADAARFLRWLVEALEQPFLLALEG